MPKKANTPVTFKVSLPLSIKKKEDYFVSSCPVLDVWTQGETKEKAIENLREALQLFLLDCFERGTLDSVLKECGFSVSHNLNRVKTKAGIGNEIDVPLPFVIDRHVNRCHG